MARDITVDFQTEISASVLNPAIFIKAEFDSGDVFVWSGLGPKLFGGDTYTGLGNLLEISSVKETQGIQANGLQFTLSGVPSSYVSIALSEEYQWRPITMWFAVLDNTGAIVSDPYLLFYGYMDVMEIEDSGEESRIVLAAENTLVGLTESKERRYTPEDQKQYFPADLGLDYVASIQDTEIKWGSK